DVRAATPSGVKWQGKPLESFISGGQPLFLFGARAGVLGVEVGGQPWLAAVSRIEGGRGAAVAMIAEDDVFAEWRETATFNITLFVATAAVLLVILYAYFAQAARAQAADRLYMEAHERVDMAL